MTYQTPWQASHRNYNDASLDYVFKSSSLLLFKGVLPHDKFKTVLDYRKADHAYFHGASNLCFHMLKLYIFVKYYHLRNRFNSLKTKLANKES